ncbi:hypothetical protein FRB90_010996 [Tulasnella sp. 427]|nr:hypothetical protein FRB90_010996 [Tulasnella sp. 427]
MESAVTRALSIYELQLLIFNHLPIHDLTSVALVCRGLMEKALDVRWHEVVDIQRLISLGWHRLHFYSKRISKIVIDTSNTPVQHDAFYSQLTRHLFDPEENAELQDIAVAARAGPEQETFRLLLPKLTDLTWHPRDSARDEGHIVQALQHAGRPLTKLTLVSIKGSSLEILINALKPHVQSLHALIIHGCVGGLTFQPPPTADRLHELAFPMIALYNPPSLTPISAYQELEVLRLVSPSGDSTDSGWHVASCPLAQTPFPKLRTLRLEGLGLFGLRQLPIPSLRRLILDGKGLQTLGEVYKAVKSITLSYPGLEELYARLGVYVEHWSVGTQWEPNDPFILQQLLPLASTLKRINFLLQVAGKMGSDKILEESPFDAVDDDWRIIVTSMNRLESLAYGCAPFADPKRLYHTPASTYKPRATITSLLDVLMGSDTLIHVNLPFSFTSKQLAHCRSRIESLTRSTTGALYLELWRCWIEPNDDALYDFVDLLWQLHPVKWEVPNTNLIQRPEHARLPQPTAAELERCAVWKVVNDMALNRAGAGSEVKARGFCAEVLENRVGRFFERYG